MTSDEINWVAGGSVLKINTEHHPISEGEMGLVLKTDTFGNYFILFQNGFLEVFAKNEVLLCFDFVYNNPVFDYFFYDDEKTQKDLEKGRFERYFSSLRPYTF